MAFRTIGLLALGLSFLAGAVSADGPVPEKRTLYERNLDFVGSDISSIFDTTLQACEAACLNDASCQAFTFNTRSNSCFPKSSVTDVSVYEGAVSGRIYKTDLAVLANLDARVSELAFLQPGDFERAQAQVARVTSGFRDVPLAVRQAQIVLAETDASADWASFSRLARNPNNRISGQALAASVNAYLRALTDDDRRQALIEIAYNLERSDRGRTMIPALRAAQEIRFERNTEVDLEDAIGKYGFRVSNTQVDADSASPRICAEFNEELIQAGFDYTPFVQLPDPAMVVSVSDGQLCLEGVEHGNRYRIVLREGLPSVNGETLSRQTELTLYVRDRSAAVRFPSRAYVLPRVGDIAIPVETVNLSEIDVSLRRIDDRNIIRTMQDGYLNRPLYEYSQDRISNEIGADVWEGTAQVVQDLNRDVTTRIPMADVLRGEPAGLYVLSAEIPGADPYDNPPATQWFVLSDLGVATYLGTDGLTAVVRGLGDGQAKQGVEVELLSRANAVLGTAMTNAEGVAYFEAGLTRGLGGNAPALVNVRQGEDFAFLSLTDPAFDLSDRGVEGREPSPPIDVFLATDRGAYRAGETIHVTALMRDPTTQAVPGVPLTAILTRPDGVEYARTTSTADMSGGHVFAMPVAGTAPRGTWRIAVLADVEGETLASTEVLVEDFLPERIDFEMTLPEDIRVGDTPDLRIDAKYLFGPPAGDLGIEGEVLLRAAPSLEGFEGYEFGRYDVPVDGSVRYLDGGTTAADGSAILSVNMPETTAAQPLEMRVTARVTEGSGRPIERQETVPVMPNQTMIGIKPLFDGTLPENDEARFHVLALTPDLELVPLEIQWTVNKVRTRYQWYSYGGDWNWEPTTERTQVATGRATLGDAPLEIGAVVDWGRHEIMIETLDADYRVAATDFYAGWYAPASAGDTPDVLQASLDAESYAIGDTARFRIVPRYAGTAVVSVMGDGLISMQTAEVVEGENIIDLTVTEEWGAGAYVTASVIRPMDVDAGRNPARALGLGYAQVDPGNKALDVSVLAPDIMEPRGDMNVSLIVDGITEGESAYVTLAAVDLGILNITGFNSPDPKDHYFGQRKLGVEMRDVYGRLIDGLNGTLGTVRSGGDAQAQMGTQSPPPTEELVTFFQGPVEVGADGRVDLSFEMPAFNGTIRLMAVAWSQTGVGNAEHDVIVRDPVVVTASVPRFMAPGDQSRMLIEIVHTDGPAGEMGLNVSASGLGLASQLPATFTLAPEGKQVFDVAFAAFDPGVHEISVSVTTPDGRVLDKTLIVPVVFNDPEVSQISRFSLDPGQTFTFDDNAFAGMQAGTGSATLAVGPLARLDAPGLLNALDRYPYGCTEQITSRAMPLLYLDNVANMMGLSSRNNVDERIGTAISEVLSNQSANGAFGLWSPSSGDLWLDAYVTDFLSRARQNGHAVPDIAFRNAVDNLRNAVNYYPDFDRGGGDLAYALMVLARESAANTGDLRYYADQKSESFSTPVALAQLGAALAFYGDQPRADALFNRAANRIVERYNTVERATWRIDYGSNRRDTAAVLTLAVEAGSNAVDREQMVTRLRSHGNRVSTQEATWTLLAVNALTRDASASGIMVDGQAPDGPIVRARDAGDGTQPVLIRNDGASATEVTVTTFGVPDVPEPAGGNGYRIERVYYNLDGEQIDLNDIGVGDRMVTVLTVIPFGEQEARLMINDPLPAGFEIDNPNLLQGGDVGGLDWLESARHENAEFRSDRFLAAVDWRSDDSFQLGYIVRAISPGTFHHPAASVEDMYRPEMRANTDPGRVIINE
ncbi:hypothetical protein SAMN04488515_3330 [Cognatiyoonia koreensis]|uniref:Apple domain-containing protein n=1 Tax=Cognatiyoonia koreensis TaxID=364200 RepID=A0A1I0RVR9_9RHOB|nr:alpha-2-macroglobulin family protein [Cognatiyoonia koreensis]SEW45427.1 hypothetical protein SAMN04488515_3330 [Cognatiyoonia koreensis]